MPTTTTIVFRGLMLLNLQRDAGTGTNFMEIGFVDARAGDHGSHHGQDADPHSIHIPRILTMKNGILAGIKDLRLVPELGVVRDWELKVTNPDPAGVRKHEPIADFRRRVEPTNDEDKKDFRWITDMEAADMHNGSLTPKIGTRNLLFILTVRHGEFSTKLLSPRLTRVNVSTEEPVEFGFSAAVTGCDIKFNGDTPVKLFAGRNPEPVFIFKTTPNTIYEISNSPSDVPSDKPILETERSHFHMYYDKLFVEQPPSVQFDFDELETQSGPDPALCGVILLGQREDPL
jgi:hypothetical protein